MYKNGQALEKAFERAKKCCEIPAHGHIDFYEFASNFSTHKEILMHDMVRRYVIYHFWVAELFREGRVIEKKIEDIYDSAKNIMPGIFSFGEFKKLKYKLEEIISLSDEMRPFEEEVYEFQNCIAATQINDASGHLLSVSQIISTIKQKESRIYELITMKIYSVENKRISVLGLTVALIAAVAAVVAIFNKT